MTSSLDTKAKREENRAMREYLELCKPWVYDLYTNYGVRFNNLYKELVHFRQPWVDAPKLHSAIRRWKDNAEPGPWPSQQIPETPDFVIPPPPLAPQHLLNRLRVTESFQLLSSVPMSLLPTHPNTQTLHYTDLSSSTPASMMTSGMAKSPNQAHGTFGPGHAAQWQQLGQASVSDFAFQQQIQTTVSETTGGDMMNDAGHGQEGNVCSRCEEQVGLFCGCNA